MTTGGAPAARETDDAELPSGLAYPRWARAPAPWWRISEPVTAVTDLALSAFALALAWRLVALHSDAPSVTVSLIAATEAGIGIAALLGAAVHGLTRQLGERWWRRCWLATLGIAILTNFALAAGASIALVAGAGLLMLLAVAVLKGIRTARAVHHRPEFRFVVVDSVQTLLIVAVVAGPALVRGGAGAGAAPWWLGVVAVSVAAGLVQRAGLGRGRAFNHNDWYHVGQAVAAWLLYRGTTSL